MFPHIRLATPQDAEFMQEIYAPLVRDTPISFELTPPSVAEMTARVTRTLTRYPWLVCAAEERLLGYAYAGGHREREAYQWSVDVSVYVHPQARRLGVGRALYISLFPILRLQGFYNAYAGIALPNPASVGLHQSLGFTAVGVYERVGYKLGAWHDVGWWQLTLQPRADTPAIPQPLPVVRKSHTFQEELMAGAGYLSNARGKAPQA